MDESNLKAFKFLKRIGTYLLCTCELEVYINAQWSQKLDIFKFQVFFAVSQDNFLKIQTSKLQMVL